MTDCQNGVRAKTLSGGPPSSSWLRRGAIGRLIVGSASLAACACAFALVAAPALAYSPRTYESQISVGPLQPEQIAIDSANRFWTSEDNFTNDVINEFNSLGEKLPSHRIEIGGYPRVYGSMAADHSNNDLYVPNSFQSVDEVYGPTGTYLKDFGGSGSLAVDNSAGPTSGRLYESSGNSLKLLNENGGKIDFTASASYISGNTLTGTPSGSFAGAGAIAIGPHGEIFVADVRKVDEFESSGEFLREISGSEAPGPEFSPGSLAVDPTTSDLLATSGDLIDEFSPTGAYISQLKGTGPSQETPFGGLAGIAVNSRGFLYAEAAGIAVDIFSPTFILPKVTYPGISSGTETGPGEASATLNAEVNPDGGGELKTCKFEYVEDIKYAPLAPDPFEAGSSVSCSQALPYTGTAPTDVSAAVSGLTPGTSYHYRLLVSNENGMTEALPRTFDLQAPSVNGVNSSNLTATTADLSAKVNPDGGDTKCRFEYGPTTGYGQSAACEPEDIGSVAAVQTVGAHLTGLEANVVYHFRLVAENPFGTTSTEDQSFNFFPPSCPNVHLRQQTGTEYLPDCRAYELVSPPDAGGTILLAEGPQSPLATSPSRFAFGGILGKVPGVAGDPPDVFGDLYVSTRTDSGWETHYVGIPGSERAEDSGPPNQDAYIEQTPSGALTNLSMNEFMDWSDPYEGFASGEVGGPGSYAPYLWDSEGNSLGRLPTNLGVVQGGEERGEQLIGAVKPSPEFNHYFFSSNAALSFAPGSLGREPGSAYDDNLEENTVSLISLRANGSPIEEGGGEYITFPGVSTNGTHILMSTGYSCSYACDPNYDFQGQYSSVHQVNVERHLFMRVGGGPQGITHEIAPGHAVHYIGMNGDGTKVYFTSAEKLTTEAEDTSLNLYMWSEKGEEEGQPLTLISKPDGASGTGTPVCPAETWTSECGVEAFVTAPSLFLPDSVLHRGPGGNGLSDNFIASENGDIYFYSPQQLDGSKGTLGQRNLYDYREGHVQYVTTFNTGPFCENPSNCSAGPVVRMQVSPNDTHVAFLTASKITAYENAGYLEMYTYDPTTGNIICVSCIPDGASPTSNVEASDNGLFMSNDGRTFFSTDDALVPQDTDGIRDVYEYVEGRPQLISSGTGSKEVGLTVAGTGLAKTGLIGVSANGTDVYFSTYDSLVARDHNGGSLKFYDARTDGGFPEYPPAAPCEAADGCTGRESSPEPPTQNGTGAEVSGGNLPPSAKAHKRKRRHHKRKAHAKRHGKRGGKN